MYPQGLLVSVESRLEASMEMDLKALANKVIETVKKWFEIAKQHAMKLYDLLTDRAAQIHFQSKRIIKKLEQHKTTSISKERADRFSDKMLMRNPQALRLMSVAKGNELAILPNHVAFLKKHVDIFVKVQKTDTTIAKGIQDKIKAEVRKNAAESLSDIKLDESGYAKIIRKHFGEGPYAPGGVGFGKGDIIEARAVEMEKFNSSKNEDLAKGLSKLAQRENGIMDLMRWVEAVSGTTFSKHIEKARLEVLEKLQGSVMDAVKNVAAAKGHSVEEDTEESEKNLKALRELVSPALKMNYRATTALYRSWIASLTSMLMVGKAFLKYVGLSDLPETETAPA